MQRFLTTDYPKLLELIYDAALDPGCWQAFLDALPACFGNASGVMHFESAEASSMPVSIGFGHDPAFAASFQTYYYSINPYPVVGFQTLPVGEVACSSRVVPVETVEKSEFFNDWMRPQGISSDHLGMLLQRSSGARVLFAVSPHVSVYSRHRETYAAQLQLLAPHMVRAIEINRTMSAAHIAEQSLAGTLEALGAAAFLVSRSGRILIANAKAQTLMRTERVVMVDSFKTLRATCCTGDKTLSAAIAAAETVSTKHDRHPLRLTSCASGDVYAAWVLPIRIPRDDMPSRRFERFSERGANPAALVLLTLARSGMVIPPRAIQVVFGLSPAEARLASAIAAGHNLVDYANGAGLSRNTVRNQLAVVFAKTGTSRQTELVAAVVGALGMTGQR